MPQCPDRDAKLVKRWRVPGITSEESRFSSLEAEESSPLQRIRVRVPAVARAHTRPPPQPGLALGLAHWPGPGTRCVGASPSTLHAVSPAYRSHVRRKPNWPLRLPHEFSSLQLAVWDIVWRLQATMLLKRREFERAVVSCQKVRTNSAVQVHLATGSASDNARESWRAMHCAVCIMRRVGCRTLRAECCMLPAVGCRHLKSSRPTRTCCSCAATGISRYRLPVLLPVRTPPAEPTIVLTLQRRRRRVLRIASRHRRTCPALRLSAPLQPPSPSRWPH